MSAVQDRTADWRAANDDAVREPFAPARVEYKPGGTWRRIGADVGPRRGHLWPRPEHRAVVVDAAGRRFGKITGLEIDDLSGVVVTALVARGGLLGIGRREQPVRWGDLVYDPGLAAFVLAASDG